MGINNVILRQIITTVGLGVASAKGLPMMMMMTVMMMMVMMMFVLLIMVTSGKCYPDNYGMLKCA